MAGDLAAPQFGLEPAAWSKLCRSVDCVIHNAALVNWLCDYRVARPSNVLGTQQVLRLATTARPKAVHLVSTITTASGDESASLDPSSLDQWIRTGGGYVASKHVSEVITREVCRHNGLPYAVYRPGMVSFHSTTGACNPSDYVSRLLLSMVQMNVAVKSGATLDVTPVDYVARSIVALAARTTDASSSLGGTSTYHLVQPRPHSYDELAALLQSAEAAAVTLV